VEVLKLVEVERVFGLPGVQNIELFDALADAPFQTFTPTNERGAVFMADAHARVTGKLGVAVVTAGPGLTNALTGIAEARLDSSAVLILVGTGGAPAGKLHQLHQIPHGDLAGPLAKGYFRPAKADEIPGAVVGAAEMARQGEPGPTVVEISSTLLMERLRFALPTLPPVGNPDRISEKLDEAVEMLRKSPAIGIYAGAGAVNAASELKALAELLQAPVATTISGRGVLPEDHPLSVGYGFGRSGTAAAWRAFRRVRTLLAVGCKYGETATGSYGLKPPTEHIHIDINPATAGSNYATTIAVAADSKLFLAELLKRLAKHQRPADVDLQGRICAARAKAEAKALTGSSNAVSPARFLRLLRPRLPRDAILVTDSGSHQFWALNDFPVYTPRSFLAPADYQAMGFSIPAAIAAKLAFPNRQVVSLVGDGGFLMSGFELLNAVRWGAKIVVVVFRDGAWGLIKEAQRRVFRRTPFTTIPCPDFRHLARSFNIGFVQVTSNKGVDLGLREAFETNETVLVEVNVDYAEPPPYVKGAGPQMFRNLPKRLQANVALRLAKRYCLPARLPDS
jgi:acetolactate synthase-1/2/3 large subunit